MSKFDLMAEGRIVIGPCAKISDLIRMYQRIMFRDPAIFIDTKVGRTTHVAYEASLIRIDDENKYFLFKFGPDVKEPLTMEHLKHMFGTKVRGDAMKSLHQFSDYKLRAEINGAVHNVISLRSDYNVILMKWKNR